MTFTETNTGGNALAAGFGALIGAALGSGNGLFGGGNNAGGLATGAALMGQGVTNEVLLQGQANIRNDIPNQTIQLQSEIFNSRAAASAEAASQTQYLSNQIGENDKSMISNGYQNRIATQQLGHELADHICDVKNSTALGFNSTQAQINAGFNATQLQAAQAKYDNLVATNALQRQLAECCCETNLNMERGFSATQLRDLQNKCDTDRQLAEIKCLISDTAKDQTIREQQGQILAMSQRSQTREIIDAINLGNCRTGNALNQIGWNEQIINPACKWPPASIYGCC